MSVGRNTQRRDTHRAHVAKDHPPCHWCGEDIDYTAHYLDPLSFQIDHVTPLARGGEDALDNIVAAHRKCNRDKSDSLTYQQPGVTFVTERDWWTRRATQTSGRQASVL